MSFYSSREDKPGWIVGYFSSLFHAASRVLDVGCDRKQFQAALPSGIEYVGVDVTPQADRFVNLDSGEKLPFSDKEFDIVVCLDTLEHLEHIHFMLDELMRVSKKHIILTLPNPLCSAFFSYALERKYSKDRERQNQFGLYAKQYGLPLERPRDRHRWFFNAEESDLFINYRAERAGWKVQSVEHALDFQRKDAKYLIKFALARFDTRRMRNLFSPTTVFVLERQQVANPEKFSERHRG